MSDLVVFKKIVVGIQVENPVLVQDSSGQALGAALVSFCDGGLEVEVTLDKHRPESFDLDVNPEWARVSISGQLVGQRLEGLVVLLET
jgi:hypothetical protein